MKTPSDQKNVLTHLPRPIGDGPDDSIERRALHVYGRSAALCFNWSENRQGHPTVTVEAAASLESGYGWPDKIQFQLSPGELAELTAVLFHPGLALRLVHRSSALKALTLLHQPPSYLCSLSAGSRTLRIPISRTDQFLLRNFLLLRLAMSQSLPSEVVLRSLDVLATQLPDASS